MYGHFFQDGIGGIQKFNVDVFDIDNGLMIPRLEGILSGRPLSKLVWASSDGSRNNTFRVFYTEASRRPFSSPTVVTAVVLRTESDISAFDYRVSSVRRRDGYLVLAVMDR